MPLAASDYVAGVRAGDRRRLAKTITLIESRRADHQTLAQEVLEALLPDTGGAVRLGVSGIPGVGKSTFIEALGCFLIEAGHRVAVLAVDPSSHRSGGSIMGDKTRMERLATSERAFVRPSPTGGSLGGVARRTREAMLACEAAGHDVVIVETVGVGQSEVAVADMVDFFSLLILPGAGDELQGMKRGIVELVDAVLVNKVDADPAGARRAERDYRAALGLFAPTDEAWTPRVLPVSGLKATGIEEAWQTVVDHRVALGERRLDQKRRLQAVRWMRGIIQEELWQLLIGSSDSRRRLRALEQGVAAGQLSPTSAAARLVDEFRSGLG